MRITLFFKHRKKSGDSEIMNGTKLRKTGIVLLAVGILSATGCGNTVQELSEEDNAKVVEYASGLLLKYDKNSGSRLVEEEPVPEPEVVPEAVPETPDQATPDAEQAEPVQGEGEEPQMEALTMEEALLVDNVSVTYAGYEIKDKYPDNGEADLSMAMSATPNYKLLILNFDVTSLSGEDTSLDMIAADAKFKFMINGENERYILTTMLLDDLSAFRGTIPAGQSTRLVLAGEVAEGSVNDIQSLQLTVTKGDEKAYITLQ